LTSVDKVLVLKTGRAVAFGTPDQVLRREPPKPAIVEPADGARKSARKAKAESAQPENGSAREQGEH